MANQVTVELYARYYKDFFEVGSKILIEKFELGIIEFEIEKRRDFWVATISIGAASIAQA